MARACPLGEIKHLVIGARYENVRVDGIVQDMALFITVGITPERKRTVLGISISSSEAEVHLINFFESLQTR